MMEVLPITIWRRVTSRGLASGPVTDPAETPVLVPLWTTSISRTAQRVRVRRGRLNVKPSPKSRDLDRAFARHVEIVNDVNVRGGIMTKMRATYGRQAPGDLRVPDPPPTGNSTAQRAGLGAPTAPCREGTHCGLASGGLRHARHSWRSSEALCYCVLQGGGYGHADEDHSLATRAAHRN